LKLEGQQAMATVLMADIQGFTTLSEHEDPTTVLDWLNELFGKLVPVVTSYSGVVNEFSGDSLLVFFGVLPRPLHLAESAYLACRAGLDMLKVIGDLNAARKFRGDPPLRMGIGINSGPVTAGGLGAEDRLHYTIIGDTVNTAQRIETVAHQLPESAVMISRSTAIAIWDHRPQFKLMPYGEHMVKGKREPVDLYRLLPKDATIGYPMENLDLMN
jgi:adenylate cyclase